MRILHLQAETKGEFFVEQNGTKIAFMSYTKNNDTRIIIDHTEVHESQKGTGLGKKLVFEAVAFAREKGIKILPLCPFARAVFLRNKDIQDVT
jgi:hypothetical protein|tara:strand:- start:148 stop:426 length:279 start_codon:yes stop_codon:yes gene_type:complete